MPDTLSLKAHNIDPALADKAVGYLRARFAVGRAGYLYCFQVAQETSAEGLAKTKPGMVMGFLGLLWWIFR